MGPGFESQRDHQVNENPLLQAVEGGFFMPKGLRPTENDRACGNLVRLDRRYLLKGC
jgi:hypothetical protein